MFTKKTIRDIDLTNKTVLLSADYNLPGDKQGEITSDYRLKRSLPTLEYLMDKKCRVIIISHRGRPEGKADPSLSLKPVAERLSEMLKRPVEFCDDCIGDKARQAKKDLPAGGILLLENTRFHPGEEANDPAYAKELAEGADVFVQDAFGRAKSKHVSLVGIPEFLPSVAGLLVEQEVDIITDVMANPKLPLAAIVGGAKIADKLEVLKRLMDLADFVGIGGAMANTFLAAKGIKIGKSKYDGDELDLAREIMAKAETRAKKERFVFYLPEDGVVAKNLDKGTSTRVVNWGPNLVSTLQSYPKQPAPDTREVADDEMILDIGPSSAAFIAGGLQLASTVIWNGTLGVTEVEPVEGNVGPFAHGTDLVVKAMTGSFGSKPFSVVGGGDTVGYLEQRGLTTDDAFNHVSNGGGDSLELMSGRKLPGVEALQDK